VSIAYYNQHAEAYFAATANADLEELRLKFVASIPASGHILDAGCGSGRDALAFHKAGYQVTAFDGSQAMCSLAHEYTKLPIVQMTFQEIRWCDEFDGIWACASLLHVPQKELSIVCTQLVRALRVGGVLYASFKHGRGERVVEGRQFTDLIPSELQLLLQASGLNLLECWTSKDVRPGRGGEEWLNALARKG
jgi:SAM-dependent methyltransferase